MKLAKDWISEHGPQGDYPKVDEPVGCFTAAQIRQIQWDMRHATRYELMKLGDEVAKDLVIAKAKEEGK
jgi:hypothetical protein